MRSDEKHCVKCGHGVVNIFKPVQATKCPLCGGALAQGPKPPPPSVAAQVAAWLIVLIIVGALAALAVWWYYTR